ncbi:MAG: CDP-alcohol phosphatidyltransferase family protein [Leptospiraceae bacterium]|nr:CDP-alcohol phosphatidyltransferase family protein [Leptospiraceae bacterium]
MKLKLNWVPNALSLGNLTLGFVSILIASEATNSNPNSSQVFLLSGIFIILAALFDGFDGMAARALNATSDLGAELDTLADLTTFGIAPGYLTYKMILENFKFDFFGTGELFPYGMLVASIFPICAAYRLARFTVSHDPSSFTGLPSPIAGVIVGLFPVAFPANTFSTFFTIPAFVIVALLMVSTIRYSKPQVAIRGKFTRGRILIILIGFGVLFFFLGLRKAPFVMYGLLVFYVSSGIISLIIQFIQDFFPDAEEK